MTIVGESSLHEYARCFWEREARKNEDGKRVWEQIQRGADPLRWMQRPKDEGGHPYKLPQPRLRNELVRIARFEAKEELEGLLIHKTSVDDDWMRKRDLVPKPYTRKVNDLATVFIERGYFERPDADGTQVRYYREWKLTGRLKGVLEGIDKPFVELLCAGKHEIVDGFGRLLPFVALLQQGLSFQPVEVFVACRESKSRREDSPPQS